MMRIFDPAAIANALTFLRHDSRRSRQRHSIFSRVAGAVGHNLRPSLCVILVVSLLATSTPAAPQTIVGLAGEWQAGLAFWLRGNRLPARVHRALTGQNPDLRPQERQVERDARVARLQIYPGDTAIGVDGRVSFVAVAYDSNSASVAGVEITWSAQDADGKPAAVVSRTGEFEAKIPGAFKITAEAAGQTAQANVIVLPTQGRPKANDLPLRSRRVSSRDLPSLGSTGRATSDQPSMSQRSAGGSSRRIRLLRAHAVPLLPEDGWGDGNYTSADDPGNGRGDPPGRPIDGGAGSGNFQLAAPVLGLPGRGIDISLGLAYNSRVWNKAGNVINFDIDRDWPAPGWSLGFGKVVDLGLGGSMIVDADGTRHSFKGDVTPYSNGAIDFRGHTADGTLIDYGSYRNANGAMTWAEVNLPNGSQIHYDCSGPGGVFPTQIIDANGNYVSITYVANTGPRIQTITDTLGRVISFFYDSHNNLTAITTPRLGVGTGDRTLVRLTYHQISLNSSSYSFGLTPVVRDPNPWLIDAIYYPGTSTGYWFGDTDSYSTYGMLAKAVEVRGMAFSGPDPIPASQGPTEQGTITTGQMTRKEVYNYPLFVGDNSGTASTNLTDAPTYTSMTETWTRDGNPNNNDSATTNYLVQENASNPSQPSIPSRKVEVTLPNGTKSIQYSYNYTNLPETDPLKALDGVVYQDETRDSSGTSLQSSAATWEKGAYDSPRTIRVQATDERSQTTATDFIYGTVYNQVTEVRNYDYGGTALLRSTRTEYQNSASYTATRHIFNLPLAVEVFAANNTTRVSRTEYQYDGQTLENTAGVIMHEDNHNPYAPTYNPVTDYRGNVTQVTSYADAIGPSGAINETRRYDINGNMIKASTSCCEQTTISYTVDTRYGYPLSQTRGSATDPYAQVTTSATYDFNTGLGLSATNEDGRTSQTNYFAGTLRPQSAILPSGAHTDYAYDDAAMSVNRTAYLAPPPDDTGAIAEQSVKLLNGRGQVRQEKALAPSSIWDIVDTVYDNMGRVSQQTRPYRSGDTPIFSTTTYDALSRTISVQAPDGSTSQSFYNEASRPDVASSAPGETTRVVDAWGRERWGRVDAQGRLVEVVEPNPSGSGSVATGGLVTTYGYNTLGNLTTVIQGAQTRSFKYDSFGRLTAQKLAETSATLNDAGQYVGTGTWGDVFSYDDRSNLISRTDARGVKTIFGYNNDPLNRLQSVSYDTTADPNHNLPTSDPNYYLKVLDAATVTFQYRTNGGGTQLVDVTQPASVTTSGVSTESFVYDSEARVSSRTLTLTSRSAYPITIDAIFDTLDRITDVRYPAEYGNGSAPRKVLHQDLDVASRLTNLTMDGASHASQIVYNASSQTTQLKVGASGANQITENYGYNPQTGLLDNQTIVRGGSPILDLSYDYAGANGKRTGQLTKILNNLNHNKDRGYIYDALGRLTQATGGPSGTLWTQNYSYDRYGNRTSVSASGNSAKAGGANAGSAGVLAANAPRKAGESSTVREGSDESGNSTMGVLREPSDPKVALPTEQLAAKTDIDLPDSLRTDAPRSISDSSFNLGVKSALANPASTRPAPQGGPPVFTDDPLVAGVTVIKAVHITELRTAVNQARALGGLGAASWTDPTLAGTPIKAVHITELRARLAEARAALGLSVASYTDPTLTVGSTTVKAVHVQELRQRVTEALAGPAGCPSGQNLAINQFVKNFYQGALNRQPNAVELQSWTDQLRQAYYQGQAQLLAVAQYFGRQLFRSQEYVNRGRSDHDYVYDLYKGYLQREPDQSGWDFWTGQVPSSGRDTVREDFALSTEFATKVASLCAVSSGGSSPIPLDGLANLSYDPATNRITTAGFQYDGAGNQTRIVSANGSAKKFQYDAANRLAIVRDDYAYTIATYTYGDTRERLIAEEGGLRTYYASEGSVALAEYTESGSSTTPSWSKSYIYLGTRLLSTLEPNGSGGERVQHHHPDRLGTRMVSNPQDSTSFEQVTLPFGTALSAESTGATNRRFTSYDRSVTTGLDYAVNRHYDAQQGRFTQVDPIGMKSVELSNPQTLNLYAYCTNDPVNHTDPAGLGFFSWLGKLFHKIGHFLSAVGNAVARILNNKWVRIGVLILGFLVPFLGPLAKAIQLALKIYNGIADVVGQMQLYGMLLQGKFKQLGMALLSGFVGSFIATIENGILGELQNYIGKVTVGGQDYIDWRKFTFKDFFNGMWHGLKTGLKDAANQLLRYRHDPGKKKTFWEKLKNALVPGYGHWCGPGIGQGAGETRTGINGVDENACRPHDGRYNTPGYNRLAADFELFGNLLTHFPGIQISDLAFGSGPSIGSKYKFGALPLFGVILPGFRFITGPH